MSDTNKNCNSCYSCYYCDYCYYCYYCYYCDSCYYCKSCDYSKNLKMTEYNLFCYSKDYNDENSFQQKRWRAFNKEVGEDRYNEIFKEVKKIIPNPNNLKLDEFWKSITNDQWLRLLEIPEAKDFKEGFEYISGQTIEIEETKTININGVEIKLSKYDIDKLQELINNLK